MRFWTSCIGQRLDDADNTRTMILCEHLLRRGHEVTLWTSAWDHIRKEWRREWLEADRGPMVREDGLKIRFMKGCGYMNNTSPRRLVDHWLAAADFRRQALQLERPDGIIASCPDHVTASAAVGIGRRVNAATIIDVRDKWPDILFDLTRKSPAMRLAGQAAMVVENQRIRQALKNTDSVVAMMESMLTWGLDKASRPRTALEKVFFLTTAPKNFDVERPALPSDHPVEKALRAAGDRVKFAFTGTFNRSQHPALLLDAVDLLKKQGRLTDRMAFLIGGAGQDADEVARRAAEHDQVHYVGWLKPNEMNTLLGGADIGLLLQNFSSEAFNNKTFSYMASGLPMISCATGDLKDLIADQKLGMNIEGGAPAVLADAIVALTENDAQRATYAANMRELFNQRFDRESNYAAYADHVEDMARRVQTAA